MSSLLSINNYCYRRGGAEVVFLEHNRLLADAGWQIIPFCMRHEKNSPTPWSDFFVDTIEFGNSYSFAQKVVRAGKITYSFEARRKITALAKKVKPSVSHAHNVYHHISPAIFGALKRLSIPTVLTLHDLKIACPAYKMLTHDGVCERCKGGKLWNVVRHRCVKESAPLSALVMTESILHRVLGCYRTHVDRFVVPSRFYFEKFVEWGWPKSRFTYIPNFVDLRGLAPHGSPGKEFIFFGRLAPEKGLATFIRALALSGAKGRIVGTGQEEKRLRRLAVDLGAKVDFPGHLAGEQLFDAVRYARAVVLPSEWYENAPMSMLEAYALERPMIGANIGGIPEMIRPGETGAIFESGNVESLAATLRKFSEMPDCSIVAMGKEGRAWAERDFTATRYRDRVLELYRSMGVKF